MSTVIRPSTTIFYTVPEGQSLVLHKANTNTCGYAWVDIEVFDGTGTIEQLDPRDNVIGVAQARPGIKLRVNGDDWPAEYKYRINGPVTIAITGWRYVRAADESIPEGDGNTVCAEAVGGGVQALKVEPAPEPSEPVKTVSLR